MINIVSNARYSTPQVEQAIGRELLYPRRLGRQRLLITLRSEARAKDGFDLLAAFFFEEFVVRGSVAPTRFADDPLP